MVVLTPLHLLRHHGYRPARGPHPGVAECSTMDSGVGTQFAGGYLEALRQ